jgi:magnesium transporter
VTEPHASEHISEDAPQLLETVEKLVAKHQRWAEGVAQRQSEAREGAGPAPRSQHADELAHRLRDTHPADIAFVLEGLPQEDRELVWSLIPEAHGEVLLELSDAVRESLLEAMEPEAIVAATRDLDADEIADLAPNLSDEVVQDILESQDVEDRAELQTALSYEEGTVGALMDFEVVSIREDVTCEVALRYLRRYDELPGQTDAIFIVDREDHLRGVVPLKTLIVTDEDVLIEAIMDREVVSFSADGEADEAAESFDRYDLVSAPVVDSAGRVIGRVTVDAVLEYVRERQEAQALGKVGLREDEDLFASVWDSAKNRGPWLALNLFTAFIASRVVGAFEGSIEKLAALAALMPIVAGIGGNSGNQTTTLIVRSLALGQVTATGARRLLAKELGISALNGVVWGGVLGVLAFLLYRNVALGGVMALAMLLNLVVAALAGFFIPLTMERFGRDPAVGSSVFLTFVTDSMGFFIFLGLATVFLV